MRLIVDIWWDILESIVAPSWSPVRTHLCPLLRTQIAFLLSFWSNLNKDSMCVWVGASVCVAPVFVEKIAVLHSRPDCYFNAQMNISLHFFFIPCVRRKVFHCGMTYQPDQQKLKNSERFQFLGMGSEYWAKKVHRMRWKWLQLFYD